MAESLSEKIEGYKSLISANDAALSSLCELSRGIISSDNPLSGFKKQVEEMIYALDFISPDSLKKYFGNKYPSKYSFIGSLKKKQKEIIESGRLGRNLSLVDRVASTCSPEVRKEILQAIFAGVNEVNHKLEGNFDTQKISLSLVKTPNELIRYMHRVGNLFLFDPSGQNWSEDCPEGYSVSGHQSTLSLISLNDISAKNLLKENPFLLSLNELMHSQVFKKKASDDDSLYALADSNSMSMQMELGCHYATIEAHRENSQIALNFHFRDTTGYSASAFRTHLTTEVIKALGLDVERDKNLVSAEKRYKNTEQAMDTFRMIIRYAAATRDVDMTFSTSKMMPRTKEVVKAFRAGVVNLADYIECRYDSDGGEDSKKLTPVSYAKKEGTLLNQKSAWKNIPTMLKYK